MELTAVSADHLLDGIQASDVTTSRLRTRVLTRAGQDDGRPLLLLHGNLSSSLIYSRLLLDLPGNVRPIAPDLRGFGETEAKSIDATRGLDDHVDDLLALLDALSIEQADVMGWSMGGGIAARIAIAAPERVRTLTLQAPISPFGFGGGRDSDGALIFADGAGTGGGAASPRLVELLAAKDADGVLSDGVPEAAAPRSRLRNLYVKPTPAPSPDEDLWVAAMLTARTGPDFYPGDSVATSNWPGFAPGSRGVLNSMAPTYCHWHEIVDIPKKPPVLWLRGADDLIVADAATTDIATLGAAGMIPNYPGPDVVPPQPTITQTRAVLEKYAAAGGEYQEVTFEDVGHTPHLERHDEVLHLLVTHLHHPADQPNQPTAAD